ncbi:MAG: hypothetical protein IJL89_04955, partial [Firmicutes bacterium]|nr:hypothetical protein [Bacillota bacterium]
MYFYRSPLHKRPVFYVDNRVFITDGKTYCADDIISIDINCILGRLFPARKNLDMIEELVSCPPLFKLYGSVNIKTIYGEIRIPRVYRVMEAYLHFKRIFADTQAYYTYGLKKLEYEYKSVFEKSYFENRHYFSSLYVLNDKNRLENAEIMEMSRQWAEECGYRLCKQGESSTFKQYVMTNNYDRWISIYADSLEGCYAAGAVSQCSINSNQYGKRPTLYFEMYEKRLVLIAYGEGDDVFLYYCGDESLLEELKCTRDMLCDDFSVPEKAAVSNRKTFKEILENTDIDICLTELAEKFGINDYFIREGYYGFDSMDRFEVREFANGYHIEAERIRPDENDKTAKEPFENIYQGCPAFDILKADEKLVSGREFSITGVNVGNGGTGFSFCIESAELHELITDGLKNGKVPVNMRNCKYTVNGKTVEFECEYRLFRGRYAFLF